MTSLNTVIRGEWLRKTTNIKYKNDGATVYNYWETADLPLP